MAEQTRTQAPAAKAGGLNRILNVIEAVGNKLPDPAVLFALLLAVVWLLSWAMSGMVFTEVDPRSSQAIQVKNLLAPGALTYFTSRMVNTFVTFPPLGVVLVAMLVLWTSFLLGFWALDIPLGIGSTYTYPAAR